MAKKEGYARLETDEDAEEDAEEEPHADSVVLIPKAAMICNMADPPTALPIDARKSRLAIRILFALIVTL